MSLNDLDNLWHWFHRGGADQAAIYGVSDCEIKKHDTWNNKVISASSINPNKMLLFFFNIFFMNLHHATLNKLNPTEFRLGGLKDAFLTVSFIIVKNV